ncbi:hypothetical protein LCGC14_1239880 [marine sediment metagenome]|uniref:HTH luxR-type domain-containing protein n=1 Tax=marine sediment metagenome TaxID=412755 RepID=A0A0F9NNC6_9ZZZZ
MPNEIDRLLSRHWKIMDLSLAGWGSKQIAEALGITPQTVSNVTNSPIFQDEMARRRGNIEKTSDTELALTPSKAKEKLDTLALGAAEKLGQLIDSRDEAIAHRSSVAVLDKVLGGDMGKVRPIVINAEAVQLLQLTLEESVAMKEAM